MSEEPPPLDLRGEIAALGARDPRRRAFGAAVHRYELAPPASEEAVGAAEAVLGATLPDDLRVFVREAGERGAGPGYGILSPLRAAARPVVAPAGLPWARAIAVAHLGCGYAAVIPLDGAARGEVWLDARALGRVERLHARFGPWYLDWIDRLERAVWPAPVVPPGACPLASSLSAVLEAREAALGLARGTLAGDALRDVLGRLPAGGIAILATSAPALFDDGDPVDPCLACAQLLAQLGGDGLRADVVGRGAPPHPDR